MLRLNRNHLSSIFLGEVAFGFDNDTIFEYKIWAILGVDFVG
jgi:hypothetical protein